jgi:hypothetical protein
VLCLRRVAALTRGALLAVALLVVLPAGASAADPTAQPEARPPSCAERFPDEGPAGVDLRLGCIVSELVGLYTPGQASAPPTISTYGLVLLAIVLGVALLAILSTRLLARRAGAALAPVTPDVWWQCPACRSVNGAGVTRCYSCGAHRPADLGVTLATDDNPGTPQSFGRGKHG